MNTQDASTKTEIKAKQHRKRGKLGMPHLNTYGKTKETHNECSMFTTLESIAER